MQTDDKMNVVNTVPNSSILNNNNIITKLKMIYYWIHMMSPIC